MSARTYGIIGLILLGIISTPRVFASRSLTILSPDFSILGDETKEITASISGFPDGEQIHIKGALFREGSTNYFGFTDREGTWIKNSAATGEQRTVTIGTWDRILRIKNDSTDSGFSGDGEYLFKIRYYYGTSGSDWSQNVLRVILRAPTPTVTLAPTPTSTPKPTSTEAPTPTPSILPTSTPTPTIGVMGTKSPRNIPVGQEISDILGIQIDAEVATPVSRMPEPVATKSATPIYIVKTLLLIGMALALLATVFAFRLSVLWKNDQKNKIG